MSKSTFTMERVKSLSDAFAGVDFNPQFSYFRSAEKKRTDLKWEDVSLKIKDKPILNGITGHVGGGEVCALMGPSGAGKSSMMNVLAGRVIPTNSKKISGSITVNGVEVDPVKYRRNIAYVMQDDLLFPTSTVYESIHFSAKLRLPHSISNDAEKLDSIVSDLIESLGLTHVQDTKVGSVAMRGVSGGERKRVAIGVELVTNPTLLFLDEPTSGLDSFNAWKVIKILQNLGSATGAAILCTIHQPSSEVFNEFENVMLLARGNVVYNGTVSDMPEIMKRLGKPIPHLTNPADYVMLVAQTTEQEKMIMFNLDTGESRPVITWENNHPQRPASGILNVGGFLSDIEDKDNYDDRKGGFWLEMKMQSIREGKALLRDPSLLQTALITSAVMNVIVGVIFWQAVARDGFNARTAISATLFFYIGLFSGGVNPVLINFPLSRGIMMREYQTGTFGALSYFIATFVMALPVHIIKIAVSLTIAYFMIGFTGNYILMFLVGMLVAIAGESIGQIVGAGVSGAKQAQEFGGLILFPQMLFSGLFIPVNEIPLVLRWLQYISVIKYSADIGAAIEFKDCGSESALQSLQDELDLCEAENITSCDTLEDEFNFRDNCISNLDGNNMNRDTWGRDVGLMFAIAAACRIIALIFLVLRAKYFTE